MIIQKQFKIIIELSSFLYFFKRTLCSAVQIFDKIIRWSLSRQYRWVNARSWVWKAVFWPQMPEPLLLWLKNQTNSPTTAAGSKGEWLLSFASLPSGQCLLPRPGRFLAFYSQKASSWWWSPGWCAAWSKAKDCYSLTICHITLRRTNVRRWHYQFTSPQCVPHVLTV